MSYACLPIVRGAWYYQKRPARKPYAIHAECREYQDGRRYYDMSIYHEDFKRGRWSMQDVAFDRPAEIFYWLFDIAQRGFAPGLQVDIAEQDDVEEAFTQLFY